MTTPKLLPPRDLRVIDPETGRLTDIWYDYFKSGVATKNVFGTTTNDSAPEGTIGELLTATAAVSLVTGTPKNVTSKLITPGDWDVWAPVQFDGAGATTTTEALASLSTVSATLDETIGRHCHFRAASTADRMIPMLIGPLPVSIAVATTYYLVAQAAFAVSTYTADGAIYARRRR
jgi:hypothetical protein